ncbi:MAG: hypothetical protein ACN2B6_01080 [Rickettsiales bacterium]
MSKAIDKIEEDVEETVKGTLFSLSSLIIQGTPVGNPSLWASPPPKGYIGGTLRGAWNASIGSPNEQQTGSKDKTGASTLANVSISLESLKIGNTFYLTNPQPYAERVEYGWSSQRPKGMVRVALAQAQQVLDSQ